MTENKLKKLNTSTMRMFTFVAIFASIFLLIVFNASNVDEIRFLPEEKVALSHEWTVNGEENVDFPSTVNFDENKTITLSCKLPDEISKNDAIFYSAVFSSQEVYVDDELIYSFATEPQLPFGQMRGTAWVLAQLKPEYAGKTLTIKMGSVYDADGTSFDGVYIGDKGEFKFSLLRENVWRIVVFCVFILIALFNVAVAASRTIVERMSEQSKAFLYFALLISSIGFWILSDASVTQFFTNRTTGMQLLCFISLICVGSFYSGLCGSLMKNQKRAFLILEFIGYVVLLVELVCYTFEIFNTEVFIDIIYVYAAVYLIFSIFEIIHHRKEYRFSKMLIGGMVVLMAGVMTGIGLFISDPLGGNSIIPFAGAFLFYILILFVVVFRAQFEMVKESTKSKAFEKMAYTDYLTGIGNRTAYEDALEELVSNKRDIKEALLFVCDLNYLKRTNDHFGHDAGDELIKAAANYLQEFFEGKGRCFRIGGDEFAILVLDKNSEAELLKSDLACFINEKNLSANTEVSMAVGYAKRTVPIIDGREIREFYSEADKNMYENKMAMHSCRESN